MSYPSGQTYVLKGRTLPFENTPGVATINKPQIKKVEVWIEDPETGTILVNESDYQPIDL